MWGSCLRNENNKGINYCRHHQDWNDTALCTWFPWQLAMGRWMFHSHSALQYMTINQTCIKSTRFLLWAVLRTGLFSCACISKEKQQKTMRSFLVGNKLRNYSYTCSIRCRSSSKKLKAGRAAGEWKPCLFLKGTDRGTVCSGWDWHITCLDVPSLSSALLWDVWRGTLINCFGYKVLLLITGQKRYSTFSIKVYWEEAYVHFYLHCKWFIV